MEQTGDYAGKTLMTTKYCLRHELGCCLRDGGPNPYGIASTDTLLLRNNKQLFRLAFDCGECVMRIEAVTLG